MSTQPEWLTNEGKLKPHARYHMYGTEQLFGEEQVNQMLDACDKVVEPDRMRCIIALAKIFGKRLNEICNLKLGNVSISGHHVDKMLRVAFTVSKKKSKHDELIPKKIVKEVTGMNIYVRHVLVYCKRRMDEEVEKEKQRCADGEQHDDFTSYLNEQYLFPSIAKGTTKVVKHKFREVDGRLVLDDKNGTIERTYTYKTDAGHLTPERCRQMLAEISDKAWFHGFRSDLCTTLIEDDVSFYKIKEWFDWDKLSTIDEYVKHKSGYVSEISKRRK